MNFHENGFMSKMVKFSSQMDEKALKQLRALAQQTDQSLSKLITEAVTSYLKRVGVRPEFRDAAEEVLKDNKELLKKFAK